MPNTHNKSPGRPPRRDQSRCDPVKHWISRSRIRRKSESILLQLVRIKSGSLEDSEDIVGDGRVEKEEQNDDCRRDSSRSLWSIIAIAGMPEDKTDSSEEKRQEQVGKEVDEGSGNSEI